MPEKLDIKAASIRRRWLVLPNCPRTVDDLSFTSRDARGFMRWWDVILPKTDYCAVHDMLGRAYAFEVLDLIHSCNRKDGLEHILAFIAESMVREAVHQPDALRFGFFKVISEFLVTGKVDR